jgi:hypothetical protein
MSFPRGPLATHFHTGRSPVLLTGPQPRLIIDTKGLIAPFLDNTVFCIGDLGFSFLKDVPVHLITSRRDRGNVPYLVTDLATDLRAGTVSRRAIDAGTEAAIRTFAQDVLRLPLYPLPVIVEDRSGGHYLVLDGTKRLSAVALADPAALPPPCEALAGTSRLGWPEMLGLFGMAPPV